MKRLHLCGILLLSASAMYAADLKDFSIYGSVRMGTWMDRAEKFLNDTINGYPYFDTVLKMGADPNPDYHLNMLPYGKLGIQYRGDRVGVTFEVYAQTALQNAYLSGVTGQTVFRLEKYYAAIYRFFAELRINDYLSFLVGQDYAPICFLYSNQMFYENNSFLNTGSLYGGRKPMLEMIYNSRQGVSHLGDVQPDTESGIEAKLAAIKVDTCTVKYFNNPYPLTNSILPKLEASCEGKLNRSSFKAEFKIVGGFQQYNLVQEIADITINPSYDSIQHLPVNCYVAGTHVGFTFGTISLMGDFATGQNWGPYGVYIGNPFVYRGFQMSYLANVYYPTFTPDTAEPNGLAKNNSVTTEADVILKFKALPSFSFETGFGWVRASHTDSTITANWHDNLAFYLQSEVTVLKAVVFTPEIGMYYYGPAKGYGRMMYAGFGTRIDF